MCSINFSDSVALTAIKNQKQQNFFKGYWGSYLIANLGMLSKFQFVGLWSVSCSHLLLESLSAHPGRCWRWPMGHSCVVPREASKGWPCPLGIPSPFIHPIPQFPAGLRSDSAPSLLPAHYKVPSCSAQRDESIIYSLCWTGTTCLFSFYNRLFSAIQLHFPTCSFILHTQTIWSSFTLYSLR